MVTHVSPLRINPDDSDGEFQFRTVENAEGSSGFEVGDQVRARSNTHTNWRTGVVYQVSPLLVIPDGSDDAFEFKLVQKAEGAGCAECSVLASRRLSRPLVITFEQQKSLEAEHPDAPKLFTSWKKAGEELHVQKHGTYWLLKNEKLQIEGQYEANDKGSSTALVGLAIGGAQLGGNVMTIPAQGGQVRWNGQEILKVFPSEFRNEFVHARWDKHGEQVRTGERAAGLRVELSDGVFVFVNRWAKSLSVKFQMCGTTVEEQGGQCGPHISNPENATQQEMLSMMTQKLSAKESMLSTKQSKAKLSLRAYFGTVYHVGDEVRVRDSTSDPWKIGKVTSTQPLAVKPYRYADTYTWDIVEHTEYLSNLQ